MHRIDKRLFPSVFLFLIKVFSPGNSIRNRNQPAHRRTWNWQDGKGSDFIGLFIVIYIYIHVWCNNSSTKKMLSIRSAVFGLGEITCDRLQYGNLHVLSLFQHLIGWFCRALCYMGGIQRCIVNFAICYGTFREVAILREGISLVFGIACPVYKVCPLTVNEVLVTFRLM